MVLFKNCFCTASKVVAGAIAVLLSFPLSAQLKPVLSQVYDWSGLAVQKLPTNDRRQVLEGTTTDLEVLEIHTSTLPPARAPHGSHTHADTEELIIVKEGKLAVTIRDKRSVLGPGSVALAIPGEEHGVENAGDDSVTYYIIKYKSRMPVNIPQGKQAGGSFTIDWNQVSKAETEKGFRRNFFDRPTSMTKRFEMHVTTLNAGFSSHDPHTHRAEEIILILKGDVSMQIGDRHEKASAGDIVFLGSNVLHALTNTGAGACEYFAFQW